MKRRSNLSPKLSLRRSSGRTVLTSASLFAAPESKASNYIAFASLIISVFALVVTGYLSIQSTRKQEESNAIQQRYAEAERNAKVAALVTELSSKASLAIDFKQPKPEVDKQLRGRSIQTLLVLNSLFMVTRGISDWDGYILDASERPLKSLERNGVKAQCQIWSESFRNFVFDVKWAHVDKCAVCSDINCDN